MLKQYLRLQQEALDDLSTQVQQQQQQLQKEELRTTQLEHYLDTVGQGQDLKNPLLRQNCEGMQVQLRQLVKQQQQLAQDTSRQLDETRGVFRKQYARVKGLEQIQQQRETEQQQKDERRLTHTLDDLSCFRISQYRLNR